MKITKRQLRRIIKEEKARLQEIFDDDSFDALAAAARGQSSWMGSLQQAIDNAVTAAGDRNVRHYLEAWVRGYK